MNMLVVDDEDVAAWLCCMVAFVSYQACLAVLYVDREPPKNRELERHQILERFYSESDKTCHNMLQVNRTTFNRLCQMLVAKGLKSSRWVSVKEQVAIFLLIAGHDTRMRHGAFDVIRSYETVHRHFHNVLRVILMLGPDVVKPARASFSPYMGNRNGWPMRYFKDCVGAIDGTYMPATVPEEDKPRYRNRKGDISHNVLVACSFDMKIMYVLAGWEGSLHASRLLRVVVTTCKDKLTVPNDKYYLGDADFPMAPGFLTPYRCTRYHLSDYRGRGPTNPRELFNYRHSSLRNVIERVFGVMKKRFAYLRTPSSYSVNTQIKLILACCIMHNIIRDADPADNGDEWEGAPEEEHDELENQREDVIGLEPNPSWTGDRDELAIRMWNDYNARQ